MLAPVELILTAEINRAVFFEALTALGGVRRVVSWRQAMNITKKDKIKTSARFSS
jgi:hypothetical protein